MYIISIKWLHKQIVMNAIMQAIIIITYSFSKNYIYIHNINVSIFEFIYYY